MQDTEQAKRQAIVDQCLKMNADGLNQGTSGNISLRHGEGLLVTPTSIPYEKLGAEDIVYVGADGVPEGRHKPSSEWRFHLDILAARPDVQAIVHAHPIYCTAIAIHGRDIPAVHYMVGVFGGTKVACAPYAIYGSAALSELAVAALADRHACLLAHHGLITAGRSLEHAYWLAVEAETLAKQYHAASQLGEPPVLSDAQMAAVLAKFGGYGLTE